MTHCSCTCLAEDGDSHADWCTLFPFPGGLSIPEEKVPFLNRFYREHYGKLVEGEIGMPWYYGDYRVFQCACGCGGRLAITGMRYALQPFKTWWIDSHAPSGIIHKGCAYYEPRTA